MSVTRCTFPWTWLVSDSDGNCRPCCQSPGAVGRLGARRADEFWNGPELQQLRRQMTAGIVPPTCAGARCEFVQGASEPDEPAPTLTRDFAAAFDEPWYLARHPDVAQAVSHRQLESGLDHFVHFGRREGREYRLQGSRETRDLSPLCESLIAFTERAPVVPVGPKDLVIGVTTVCNLRCVMCPHGRGQITHPQHLDLRYAEVFEPLLAAATRVELVGIGEPMLAPLFWRLLELGRRYPRTHFRTNSNGHFLRGENLERLLESPLGELSLSLDAATAATYARIRGGDFAAVIGNVAEFCRRRRERGATRPVVTLNFVVMRENLGEAEAFVDLAAALGVDTVVFSKLTAMPDEPAWRVQRGSWWFHYAEQHVAAEDPGAREVMRRAKQRCAEHGLECQFILGANAWN